MTTQSDREKAEKHAMEWVKQDDGSLGRCPDCARDSYLAGAEAKDLEWQAKVQGLVDALEHIKKRDPACSPCREHNTKEHDSEVAAKALSQFTSGQPAKGVMVPEGMDAAYDEIFNSTDGFRDWTPKEIWDAAITEIKGIGKAGGK